MGALFLKHRTTWDKDDQILCKDMTGETGVEAERRRAQTKEAG